VLIAGGCADDGCTSANGQPSSEFYVPGRGFVAGPPMLQARDGHTATTLVDGRILILGGFAQEGTAPIAAAEAFDPATGTFRPAGTLHVGRGGHTATLLPDGRVLIAGGWTGPRQYTASVELFDPATNSFLPGPAMPQPRHAAAAVALPGGDILVTGGQDQPARGLSSTVVYDRAAGAWRPGAAMATPRFKHAITTMDDGRVLVLGGATDDTNRLASTEILDPAAGGFRPGPAMSAERFKFIDAVARTTTGRLVVAGGAQVDVLAADGQSFTAIPAGAGTPRWVATATALPGGSVLVVGGYDERVRVHPDALVVASS
jgi:Kelch motif protein